MFNIFACKCGMYILSATEAQHTVGDVIHTARQCWDTAGLLVENFVLEKLCDCGALKAKTTHAGWCSTMEEKTEP